MLGLFHAAISQSGSALNGWANPQPGNTVQKMVAKSTAEFTGCDTNVTSHAMVQCLRGVDAVRLVDSVRFFKVSSNHRHKLLLTRNE